MRRLRAILWQWHVHGLPRCTALTGPGKSCWRLMWPWQQLDGDGEFAYHAGCVRRQTEYLALLDREAA